MFCREMATVGMSVSLATTLGEKNYICDFHGEKFELHQVFF